MRTSTSSWWAVRYIQHYLQAECLLHLFKRYLHLPPFESCCCFSETGVKVPQCTLEGLSAYDVDARVHSQRTVLMQEDEPLLLPKKIRRPQVWQMIRENIYTHRKPKVQHEDEVMVCHCDLPPDGGPACGPDCLNRVLNMECVPVSFSWELYTSASPGIACRAVLEHSAAN